MAEILQALQNLSGTSKNELVLIFFILFLPLISLIVYYRRRLGRSIFYGEETFSRSNVERLNYLEHKISDLEKSATVKLSKKNTDLLNEKINTYLNNNIEPLIKEKIDDNDIFEKETFKNLDKTINTSLKEHLSSLPDDYIRNLYVNFSSEALQKEATESLFELVDSERKSSVFLKTFMINLFVMVNIGLFILYFFKAETLNQYTVISLAGLYISLVGFIIYIFRTSNSRTSVLLALKEDYKKQISALDYIRSLEGSRAITEFDIDFLRMLMTNHSERERNISHPYEILLKEISGSNIQFKGGSMTMGSTTKKTTKRKKKP